MPYSSIEGSVDVAVAFEIVVDGFIDLVSIMTVLDRVAAREVIIQMRVIFAGRLQSLRETGLGGKASQQTIDAVVDLAGIRLTHALDRAWEALETTTAH